MEDQKIKIKGNNAKNDVGPHSFLFSPSLQVGILTKKVEQLRSELEKRTEEQEDSVMDVKRRHEREKAMMLDENKKLIGDVERVSR